MCTPKWPKASFLSNYFTHQQASIWLYLRRGPLALQVGGALDPSERRWTILNKNIKYFYVNCEHENDRAAAFPENIFVNSCEFLKYLRRAHKNERAHTSEVYDFARAANCTTILWRT